MFYFKKWYLDFISGDGKAGIIYFIHAGISFLKYDRAIVYYYDGSKLNEFSFPVKFISISNKSIVTSLGTIEMNDNNCKLHLSAEKLLVDLNYKLNSKFKPVNNKIVEGEKYLNWDILFPKGNITGELILNEVKVIPGGAGYCDYVEFNFSPFKFPVVHLHWGRIHCGELSLVYDLIKFSNGEEYYRYYLWSEQSGLIAKCDNNTIDKFAIEYLPGKVRIIANKFSVSITGIKEMLNEFIIAENRIPSRILRNRLRLNAGNPVEQKFFGNALLKYEGQEYTGSGLFEKVIWKK